MPVEYEISEPLQELVDQVLNNQEFTEFTPLREAECVIKSCLKVKLDKNDEPVQPKGAWAEIKKIGPLHRAFIQGNFILALDFYVFTNMAPDIQRAAIHKALMGIKVNLKDDGSVAYSTRKPEIQEFQATIVRFGAWAPGLSELRQALIDAGAAAGEQLVETLQGE